MKLIFGSVGFGNIRFGMRVILNAMQITFITIRSSTVWLRMFRSGHTRRIIDMLQTGLILQIGREIRRWGSVGAVSKCGGEWCAVRTLRSVGSSPGFQGLYRARLAIGRWCAVRTLRGAGNAHGL